jgi:hypothetical protein
MTAHRRLALVGAGAALALLVLGWLPPLRQDAAYHRLADDRAWLGVPNAANVLSNAAFVVVAGLGLSATWRGRRRGPAAFVDAHERWPYTAFFVALALTGLGSAYYHWAPDSARLAVDRLPLAVAIMALLAAVIAERASATAGMRLLVPLMLLGMASVIVWHLGEQQGRGDLRLYALVHFYPMVAVPLLLVTGEARYTGAGWLGAATVVYGLAKLCEVLDGRIFAWGAMVSGHTLKHLGAAAAAYCVVAMLRRRRPARRDVGVTEPAPVETARIA